MIQSYRNFFFFFHTEEQQIKKKKDVKNTVGKPPPPYKKTLPNTIITAFSVNRSICITNYLVAIAFVQKQKKKILKTETETRKCID